MNEYGMQYHYTSASVLLNILKTKRFRLTHCNDLNDRTEGKFLLDKLRKDINNHSEIFRIMTDNIFIGCFCASGNFPVKMKSYGKVNIGFDFEAMQEDLRFTTDVNGKCHNTSGISFGNCNYTTCKDKNYMNVLNFVNERLKDIDFNNISSQQYAYLSCCQCFFLKPIKYKDENESRIVSYLWRRKPLYDSKTCKHYIEFHFTPDKVRSITIGPSCKENDRMSIEEFLDNSSDYKHVFITNCG